MKDPIEFFDKHSEYMNVLGEWEKGFVASVLSQLKNKKPMTMKQLRIMGKVMYKVEAHVIGVPECLGGWEFDGMSHEEVTGIHE